MTTRNRICSLEARGTGASTGGTVVGVVAPNVDSPHEPDDRTREAAGSSGTSGSMGMVMGCAGPGLDRHLGRLGRLGLWTRPGR